MYVPQNQWTNGLRQGDILAGHVILGPEILVSPLNTIVKAVAGPGTYKAFEPIPKAAIVRFDHFLVISQCCDIEREPRILVTQLFPVKAAGNLSDDHAICFRSNQIGLNTETGGVIARPGPLGISKDRVHLIAVGHFFLAAISGVFEDDKTAVFSNVRGIRTEEAKQLKKVAELTAQMRHRLRDKLTVFFGRIPQEDEELLFNSPVSPISLPSPPADTSTVVPSEPAPDTSHTSTVVPSEPAPDTSHTT